MRETIEKANELLAGVASPGTVGEARQLGARKVDFVGNRTAVVGEFFEDRDEDFKMAGTRLAVGRMRFDGNRVLHQLLNRGERTRVGRGGSLVVAKQHAHHAQQIVLHE